MDTPPGEHLPTPRDSGGWSRFADAQDRFSGWISRLYRERGVPEDAVDDLIQRVWAAVWEAVRTGRYDPSRAAASTYVHAVAMNIWRQWAERERPRRATGHPNPEGRGTGHAHPGPLPATPVASTLDAMQEAEAIDAVREAMYGGGQSGSDLSADDAQILRLLASGAGDRDLAKALGISPSTANARKRRALATLRDILVRRGINIEDSPHPGLNAPERRTGSADEHTA